MEVVYVIVKRNKLRIGEFILSEEEINGKRYISISLPFGKNIDDSKKENITKHNLLYLRAFLICMKLELMMLWQYFNRNKTTDQILKWNLDEDDD